MPKLFMLLIGSTPPGRNIEQHDVFFGIGESVKDLIPAVTNFGREIINCISMHGERSQAWTAAGYRLFQLIMTS